MTEAAVVAFLEANPDFFQKQPELLNKLMLPHDVPGATSLVTRQLGVLRERNQALRARLGMCWKALRAIMRFSKLP